MLKALTFVQIGDVHYPDAVKETLADIKDTGFPPAIAELARLRPLVYVARKLTSVIESSPNAVLLTGDLTTFGDPGGYRDCIKYLNDLINFRRVSSDGLHVVPGNHDVNRSKVDPKGDLKPKFAEFSDAWTAIGFPILAVDTVRKTPITLSKTSASGATVFSLNSSLGCGEKRYPEEIRDKMDKWLDAYASTAPKDKAFALLGETLDTPAFDVDQIDGLCQSIGSLESNTVPIVVSHHNILPQALPRIAVYTELINAGIVRSRLSHLQRPILYCHGHIHDNPVEVVSEPGYPGSRLVCIAAPTFSTGFNTISIEFASRGAPLGCIVNSFRINSRDAEVRQQASIRIPFHLPSYLNVQSIGSPVLLNILANLPVNGTRLPDLIKKVPKLGSQMRTVVSALLEGEWLGTLTLGERQEQPEYWIVEKALR
jgi:hypothetical protein